MPLASVLPVLLTEELWASPRGGPLGLATPIFSFSLSSLEPKSLRMVILIIILVQVLCCHLITKITRNGTNGAMFVTLELGGTAGDVGLRNVGRTWPVRVSSVSPAMADGGAEGNKKRNGGVATLGSYL